MAKKLEKSQAQAGPPGKTKSSLSQAQTAPLKHNNKNSSNNKKQQPVQHIAALERSIVESGVQDLNPLVDLLTYLVPEQSSKVVHASAFACQRTFTTLARAGKLAPASSQVNEGEAIKQVRDWLRARLADFADKLSHLLRYPEASIRTMALKMLIDLVHSDTDLQCKAKEGVFDFSDGINRRLVHGLLRGPPLPSDTRSEFLTRHLNSSANDLIRYYFLREAAALCNSPSATPEVAENLLLMLEVYDLDLPNSAAAASSKKKQKSDIRDYQTPLMMQKAFQSAWQALLPKLRNEDQVKRVLAVFHRLVLPNLPKPNMFLDFMVYCCNMGGTVGLLALNGLFTLITKHNLDYPDFYTKLYGMLDRQVLHVRYRARFLRMLDLFLSSTHLPVNLVASFIKRLSRLSLNAPPAAIVSIVPFVYNLFKKHPQTVSLIHQPVDEETRNQLTTDPFLSEETDPLKTQAIDSSVWELAGLSNHYLASVSGLAKVFNQQLTKQNYDMEDFLDHTFASLFDTEMARKVKNAPALDLPPPKAKKVDFFPRQEPTEEQQLIWSDPITDLWNF